MNHNVNELLRELERQGFKYRQTKGLHYMVYAPDGSVVTTMAGTPSDGRALKNTIAALRRAGFTWKGR